MTSYALPHRHLPPAGTTARRLSPSQSQKLFPRARRRALISGLSTLLLLTGLATTANADPITIAGDQLLELRQTEAGWDLVSSDAKSLAPIKSTALPFPVRAEIHAHSLVASDGGWFLSAASRQDGRSQLILLRKKAGGVQSLPSPATTGRVLLQPNLLVKADQPEALLWIEGASVRESAVRVARWTGAGWSASEVISPQGPGTQIALDAKRLADGSVLAVWAGFDGEDDEIMWSRSSDGASSWSVPQAISSNQVPDVTPTLAKVDGGALVAWSGYDGNDYRVWVAHFDGKSWTEARRHGERGSVFPRFAPEHGERPTLVFKQTAPAAWRISRVRGDGSVERTLSLEPNPVQPVVIASDDQGVVLRAEAATKSEPGADRSLRISWQE